MHIVQAKLGQASTGDNEVKLMMKHAPEWVQTSDPVIRSPAHYLWTTAPALIESQGFYQVIVSMSRDNIPSIHKFQCFVKNLIFFYKTDPMMYWIYQEKQNNNLTFCQTRSGFLTYVHPLIGVALEYRCDCADRVLSLEWPLNTGVTVQIVSSHWSGP